MLLLADLAEAACGSVLQTSGQTEILKLLPPDQVRATREKIAAKFERQSSGLAPVERLLKLKWSVSELRRRTISPFSKVTVPEWIENRIKQGTFESIRAAIQMDPANPGLIAHFGVGARQSCCHRKNRVRQCPTSGFDLQNSRARPVSYCTFHHGCARPRPNRLGEACSRQTSAIFASPRLIASASIAVSERARSSGGSLVADGSAPQFQCCTVTNHLAFSATF